MTGSTGNIYTVVVARQPTCDCPQGNEGKQCKHVIYVLAKVLHARHEYVYQLALLATELQEIFARAPPPLNGDHDEEGHEKSKGRKPVEGDCPICFSDMEEEGREKIVWCRAACGQNIHKECFEMWASTKRKQSGSNAQVTCPYCRSVWEGDEDMVKRIQKTGGKNREGYVNVADQLGISQTRGESRGRCSVRWEVLASFVLTLESLQITARILDGGRDTHGLTAAVIIKCSHAHSYG